MAHNAAGCDNRSEGKRREPDAARCPPKRSVNVSGSEYLNVRAGMIIFCVETSSVDIQLRFLLLERCTATKLARYAARPLNSTI